MKRITTAIAATLCLALLPATAEAQKGKPPVSTPSVIVHDSGNGVPLRIGSDGKGTYKWDWALDGDWRMDSGWGARRPSRAHSFDFSEPVVADNAPPPFFEGNLGSLFILYCSKRSVNLQTLPLNQSALCPLIIHFDWNRINYRIGINSASEHIQAGGMQGEDARVTCTATDPTGCSSWRIEPSGSPTAALHDGTIDNNPKSIGMLFDKNGEKLLGYYYFSFLFEAKK